MNNLSNEAENSESLNTACFNPKFSGSYKMQLANNFEILIFQPRHAGKNTTL